MLFAVQTTVLGLTPEEEKLLKELAGPGLSEKAKRVFRTLKNAMNRAAGAGDVKALRFWYKKYKQQMDKYAEKLDMDDMEMAFHLSNLYRTPLRDASGNVLKDRYGNDRYVYEDLPIHVAIRSDQPEIIDLINELTGGLTLVTGSNMFAEPGMYKRNLFQLAAEIKSPKESVAMLQKLHGLAIEYFAPSLEKIDDPDEREKAIAMLFGTYVNRDDDDGNNALHLAVMSTGAIERVKYLVPKGADFRAKNLQGTTPVVMASKKGKGKVWHYLTTKGRKGIFGKFIGGVTGFAKKEFEKLASNPTGYIKKNAKK